MASVCWHAGRPGARGRLLALQTHNTRIKLPGQKNGGMNASPRVRVLTLIQAACAALPKGPAGRRCAPRRRGAGHFFLCCCVAFFFGAAWVFFLSTSLLASTHSVRLPALPRPYPCASCLHLHLHSSPIFILMLRPPAPLLPPARVPATPPRLHHARRGGGSSSPSSSSTRIRSRGSLTL